MQASALFFVPTYLQDNLQVFKLSYISSIDDKPYCRS